MAGDEKQLAFVGIARAARLRAPVGELLGSRGVGGVADARGCERAERCQSQGAKGGHAVVLVGFIVWSHC